MSKLISRIRNVTNSQSKERFAFYGLLIAASGYFWGIKYMLHLIVFCSGIIAFSNFFIVVYCSFIYKLLDKKEFLIALGLLLLFIFIGYFFLNYMDWFYILLFSCIVVGAAAYQSE